MANSEVAVTLDISDSLAGLRSDLDRLGAWWSSLTPAERDAAAEDARSRIAAAVADALAAIGGVRNG